jgi:hypothetical protein
MSARQVEATWEERAAERDRRKDHRDFIRHYTKLIHGIRLETLSDTLKVCATRALELLQHLLADHRGSL